MSGSMIAIIVIAVILLFVMMTYNKMKKNAIKVDNAFGDLDTVLMQRVDQLDNLIQTARVATDKEMEFMQDVVGLRSQILKASSADEKLIAHRNLEAQLPTVYLSVENYPDVKFNENYLHIQRSINEIEERIQAARRTYNAHVGTYNTSISMFPAVLLAGIFQFKSRQFYETAAENRENVDVKALFNR